MEKPLYTQRWKDLNQTTKGMFTMLVMFSTDVELGGGANVN